MVLLAPGLVKLTSLQKIWTIFVMNIREQAKQLCARYLSKFKWVENSLFLLNFIVWSKSKKSRTNFPPCRQSVFTSRNKQLKWLISCEPIVENAFLFKSFYDAFTWLTKSYRIKSNHCHKGSYNTSRLLKTFRHPGWL